MKDVGVMPVACAARIELLRRDAFDFAKQLIQQTRIAMPPRRLLIQTPKLRVEHGSLPFTQAVVRSINVMAIEPLARHAPAVVHGAGEVLDFIIIGDDCPAFARSHQLAGLKTKCACNAELRPRGERFAFGLRSAEQGKLGHGFLWNDLYSDTEPARPGRLLFDVMTLS